MTLPEDEDGNVDRLEVEPADIETAADGARFLGIPPSSTDEEIELAKRELVMQLHPDQGGTEGAFKSLETSEDLLKEYTGGDMDDAEDYRRWEVDGPWEPGTRGFDAVNNNESGRYVTETGKTDTSRTETDTGAGPGFGVDRSDFYSAEYERYRETAEDPIHDWPYNRLQEKIIYKAKEEGIPVAKVNPRETSITCRKCNVTNPQSRKTRDEFECVNCGYTVHSDVNAAMNIAQRSS